MTEMEDFPKSIEATIDKLYSLREERYQAQRSVDKVLDQERSLYAYLMEHCKASDIDGAKGQLAIAVITQSSQAEIVDFPLFVQWAVKENAYSCLQKRVGITAIREYWDNEKLVPGLEQKTVETVNLVAVNG